MVRARELWRSWGAAGLTALGVATAALFQHLYDKEAGGDSFKPFLAALAVLGAVTAAVVPVLDARARHRREQGAAEAAKAAREEQVLAINDALDPLVEKLGEIVIAHVEGQAVAADKLIVQALNAAAQVIGPDRTRVSYWEADAVGGPYRLVCKESTGRHTKPRTTFLQGHADGDFVLGLLTEDKPFFCDNVVKHPPPGWDSSRSREYETFISVPASVGTECIGMLTVDAPRSGDLAEQDIPLIRVIGTVIAASVKIAEASSEDEGSS